MTPLSGPDLFLIIANIWLAAAFTGVQARTTALVTSLVFFAAALLLRLG